VPARRTRIVLGDLAKTFRDGDRAVVAVENVSFEIFDREFVAIVGPSGCGKSTILNMLGGLVTPSAGRVEIDGVGTRVGRVEGEDVVALLDHDDPLAAIRGEGEVTGHWDLDQLHLCPPIRAPEIWCAGVTYERSRDARLEEAETEARDVYSLVYEADRPELFMKDAHMLRTVGPGGAIRVRSDSRWMVPEPELALVLGAGGEPVAVTIGNDVSSRDIEGANPLYIPQAKIFAGACAIGPALAVPDDWDAPFPIRMRIVDAGGDDAANPGVAGLGLRAGDRAAGFVEPQAGRGELFRQ